MTSIIGTAVALLSATLRAATLLIFAALGGVFSERSGVINIALEGIMLIGAFTAMSISYFTGSPWLGVLGAMLAGILIAAIHALVSIEFKANQVVSGTAINIFAVGLTGLLLYVMFGTAGQSPKVNQLGNWAIPVIKDIPIIGPIIGNHVPFVYMALVMVAVTYWVLWKTPFGLRVRAVGEHPAAADTVGVSVKRIRYICVMISGLLAGLGGCQSFNWVFKYIC